MFELIASFDSKDIKGLANRFIDCMTIRELQDPIKSFYAGVIAQKAGRLEEAVDYLEHVAKDNQFTEQPVKLNACMKLAEFYNAKNNLFKTKFHLGKVVSYMENISRKNDPIYKEATTILKSL